MTDENWFVDTKPKNNGLLEHNKVENFVPLCCDTNSLFVLGFWVNESLRKKWRCVW